MIKICSLDFLNKETFEDDVLTEDGKVLISGGEKITPDILLKLYYKSIYVKDAIKDTPIDKIIEDTAVSEISEDLTPEIAISEAVEESIAEVQKTEEKFSDIETEIADAEIVDKSQPENDSDIVEKGDAKGPHKIHTQPTPVESKENIDQETGEKGPRQVESAFIAYEEEKDPSKGPRAAELSEPAIKEERKIYQKQETSNEPIKEPIPEIKPEDMPLEFNEVQAKNIVENSVKLGKMLGFSQKELKELEQVAYYCNIGITKFKKKDIERKSFRQMKALASYQKLIEEETVPAEIAEIIKYSANSYNPDTFPLNSKIPYHHIVCITSFYDDTLSQGESKDDILLKMLQMGGNQFNIFVLHKFINIMKEN